MRPHDRTCVCEGCTCLSIAGSSNWYAFGRARVAVSSKSRQEDPSDAGISQLPAGQVVCARLFGSDGIQDRLHHLGIESRTCILASIYLSIYLCIHLRIVRGASRGSKLATHLATRLVPPTPAHLTRRAALRARPRGFHEALPLWWFP